MTRHETNKYNMYKAVAAVVESNTALLTEFPVFGETLSGFKESLTEIDAVDKKYLTAADGKTKTKSNAEDDLLEDVMPIKSALFAVAIKNKNEELKALTTDSEWALKKMRDADFLKKAELIKAEATARLAELAVYKVTEVMLTELQEKSDAYGEALSGKDTGFTNRSA